MKRVNVTFSIPRDAHARLHGLIGRRKMSAFVTHILNKALEEKMQQLRMAYAQAEEDSDRKEMINAWKVLDGEDWGE